VWALARVNEVGRGGLETSAALGLGVLFLAGFVAWERRAPEPMLPLRLFRSRAFTAANTTAFLMIAALLAAVFLASQYFQVARGVSPLGTGLRVLPWTGIPLLVSPAAGALSDRIGQRPVMAAGMLLQGAGLGWFALAATTSVGYGTLVGPLLVAGVGISMALPTTATAALSAVAPADMGKASGANGTLQRFGGAFGIAVATAVFAANGQLGTPVSFTAGFRPALALAAGLSLLGVVSALATGGSRPQAVRPREPVAAAAPAGRGGPAESGRER
jgi:Major Facilitator Superfamily